MNVRAEKYLVSERGRKVLSVAIRICWLIYLILGLSTLIASYEIISNWSLLSEYIRHHATPEVQAHFLKLTRLLVFCGSVLFTGFFGLLAYQIVKMNLNMERLFEIIGRGEFTATVVEPGSKHGNPLLPVVVYRCLITDQKAKILPGYAHKLGLPTEV
jgi:TRAP-type C4-dicarboxylate transport system permease small subunit